MFAVGSERRHVCFETVGSRGSLRLSSSEVVDTTNRKRQCICNFYFHLAINSNLSDFLPETVCSTRNIEIHVVE